MSAVRRVSQVGLFPRDVVEDTTIEHSVGDATPVKVRDSGERGGSVCGGGGLVCVCVCVGVLAENGAPSKVLGSGGRVTQGKCTCIEVFGRGEGWAILAHAYI